MKPAAAKTTVVKSIGSKSPGTKSPATKAPGSKPAVAKAAAGKATGGKPAATVSAAPKSGSTSAPKSPVKAGVPTKVTAAGAASKPIHPARATDSPGTAKPPGAGKGASPKAAAGKAPGRSSSTGRSSKKPLEPASARSVAAAAIAAPNADANGYVVINGRRVRMISTKDIQVSKRSRSADAKPSADTSAIDVSLIKTKFTKKELEPYKQLLLQRRAEILGLVNGMEQEALRSSGGNLSHMPIHMADIGTDTADQDFALNLAEKERETINEIDAALQRIEDGTFGICQATGKPIPKARLDAKPWAKYTIEAARMFESGHKFAS